jgi:hypothetical protein
LVAGVEETGVPVTVEIFLGCVSLLTGTDVKGADEIDRHGLADILSDENRVIDADFGGWRSAFRSDGDHDSEVMAISIPN